MRDLHRFLHPRSIAVIGASPDASKLRGMAVTRLRESGFEGDIYPVNPSHREVMGLKAYARVADLPATPDLAILMVVADQLVDALEACGAQGIGSAMVLSGLPAGPTGDAIQARLGETARRYGMILLGPNALGYWNPAGRVCATFAPLVESAEAASEPRVRAVSIVSQSGGVGNSMYDKCHKAEIGVRYLMSLGNEADLHALEVIDWLIEEGGSRIVCLYLEGFREPQRFAEVAAKAADRDVALIVIKAGRSAAGQRAAVSHTGHLTGVDTAYDAVFERYGVIRVADLEAMLTATKALVGGRPLASPGVAIVSTGGGFAAMLADACVGRGLDIPDLDEALRAKLADTVPDYGNAANPLDLPGGYLLEDKGVSLARVLEDIRDAPGLDGIILCFGLNAPGRIESMRPAIGLVLRKLTKPVLFHSPTLTAPDNRRALAELGVHEYAVPECAFALSVLHRHAAFRARWGASRPRTFRPQASSTPLDWGFAATLARLRDHGLSLPPQELVASAKAAVAAAGRFGAPVALKIQSPDLPHKTEVGGVRLDLRDAGQIEDAYASLRAEVARRAPRARIDGVLVQAMAARGVEMAVGVIRDADFGPLLMLSAGGVLIEVFKDAVFSPLPVTREDAAAMIARLKSAPALGPVRGGAPADVEALADLLAAVSEMFEACGDGLAEMEFNPVIVHPRGQGVTVVDFLVVERASALEQAAVVETAAPA